MSKLGVESAIKCAVENHFGQRDKSGAPYILHVLRVWEAVRNDGANRDTQIVALLHDVVEDTSVTIDQIGYWFGDTVAEVVDAITKRKGESQKDYLRRVQNNPVASFVKIRDSRDNFGRLASIEDSGERDRLTAKYQAVFDTLGA